MILDLGLIGRHKYYPEAIFEAHVTGLGFTIANGGRYDNLLKRFGRDLPATGFAIYLERLLSVLPEEDDSRLLVLVGGGVEGTKAAVALRSSGVPILHLSENLELDATVKYASSVEAGWICYLTPDGAKLACAKPGAPFEEMRIDEVAERVLGVKHEGVHLS